MRLTQKQAKQLDSNIDEKVKADGNNDKLIIYGELPTMNSIINNAKVHWTEYRKVKSEFDDAVAWYAEKQNVKFFEKCELEITYYMENRKKDPDNILSSKKFILDGLVQAGVLENDGWKQIKGFDESWEVDKKNPRVEVEFKEGVNNDN